MTSSLRVRAAIVSVVLFAVFIGVWHLATRQTASVANMSPEYAKLMGVTATQGKSAMPGPADVGEIGLSTWMKGSSALLIRGDMPIMKPSGMATSTAMR